MTKQITIDIILSYHWPNKLVVEMDAEVLAQMSSRKTLPKDSWQMRFELTGHDDSVASLEMRLKDWISHNSIKSVPDESLSLTIRPAPGHSFTRRPLPTGTIRRLKSMLRKQLTD